MTLVLSKCITSFLDNLKSLISGSFPAPIPYLIWVFSGIPPFKQPSIISSLICVFLWLAVRVLSFLFPSPSWASASPFPFLFLSAFLSLSPLLLLTDRDAEFNPSIDSLCSLLFAPSLCLPFRISACFLPSSRCPLSNSSSWPFSF